MAHSPDTILRRPHISLETKGAATPPNAADIRARKECPTIRNGSFLGTCDNEKNRHFPRS